jgi:hypothetical protein
MFARTAAAPPLGTAAALDGAAAALDGAETTVVTEKASVTTATSGRLREVLMTRSIPC